MSYDNVEGRQYFCLGDQSRAEVKQFKRVCHKQQIAFSNQVKAPFKGEGSGVLRVSSR